MTSDDIKIPNIQKIIFVQNCGESGSNFIKSLLDNHPQIMSIPALHIVDLYVFWQQILIRSNKKQALTHEILREGMEIIFYKLFTPYIDNFNQMGEHKDQMLYVEKQEFFKYFFALMSQHQHLDLRYLILSIYTAYNYCFNKKFDDNAFILYPSHSRLQNAILDISAQFQQSYFLYSMREPVQNISSLFRWIHSFTELSEYNAVHSMLSEICDDTIIHWSSKKHISYNKIPYHEDFDSVSRYMPKKMLGAISYP